MKLSRQRCWQVELEKDHNRHDEKDLDPHMF